MSKSDNRLLLTVPQAAATLSVGRSFMYTLVMRGEIASLKLGRSRRIPRDALVEFVQRLEAEQAEEVAQ